jgi:phage-related protein
MPEQQRRPLIWVDSSKKDLMEFPPDVQDVMGRALLDAQYGGKHPDAKPLTGFGGAGVLEVVDDFDGDTYRTVYTVKLEGVVYVLHAFQKKSKTGRETPKQEIDKVRARLKRAQEIHQELKARGQLPLKPPSKKGGKRL